MESILALALEYTLKYWLKSFSRDQFKLQGRTVQLSNLDINGDALHSSMGLPPALNVTTAKVGKLEIVLPSVSISNLQIEPILVQIDRLDLVLEEKSDLDPSTPSSSPSLSSSAKGSGYGFADKIADGMTLEILTVNLLLETRGGGRCQGGASWASPLASITICNLFLYTTNENWQVVNLKEAREFSSDKKFIYLFKKLEWESLSIDLLPHPDMFMDANIARTEDGGNQRDDDGAKRVFFGGERFIEGISGHAYITVQRTELNSPLGLEVQLHITEAVCPGISEPGLRALLRFMTGLYVCLNRGDVDSKTQQRSTEAAGLSIVSIVVDHIFLCIKDTEFRLELLMQSLFFSRASVSGGEIDNNLSRVMIGGLFLRDTYSRPPCTLVQPSMQAVPEEPLHVPDFGKNFCPPIYPLGDQEWQLIKSVPLLCLHSLQIKPSPIPPSFASQTVINCQPLMIDLQEGSCLRISSFLADGIVVNPGAVLPDFSVNSLIFTLKELDVTVPLDIDSDSANNSGSIYQSTFSGARLQIENLFFSESPSLKLRLLNLEKDPACFCLWEGQPVDASQRKWTTRASLLSLSLETCTKSAGIQSSLDRDSGLWRCVELKDACVEVAMVTADGSPLTIVPPPGGIVRIGVACQNYLSNTSVEQLFFVLDLYAYFGKVSEKIVLVGNKTGEKRNSDHSFDGKLIDKVPNDTAVSLAVKDLQIRFLESSPMNSQGMPLVQFIGGDLFIKVTHRTLGGAVAVSSTLLWDSVEVDCVDTERNLAHEKGTVLTSVENGLPTTGNGCPELRPVFWIHNQKKQQSNGKSFVDPFVDISMVHIIPLNERDAECHSLNVSACISGVRLGGGMNYAESLFHRFGILGPDGVPGKGLSKELEKLRAGPLSKLFKPSRLIVGLNEDGSSGGGKESGVLHLGKPDDVNVSIRLKNWIFALEGAQEMAERWWFYNQEDAGTEERCWHTTFHNLHVKAKSSPKNMLNGNGNSYRTPKYPVELVTVSAEGLQILKPNAQKGINAAGLPVNGIKETAEISAGVDLEVRMVVPEDTVNLEMEEWVVENVKFSVKEPIEAVVTKDELQYLTFLCKSEVESMGRITAGILRLLKLEGSIGQAAIKQLSNLGNEGIDKVFSPGKLSRSGSFFSTGRTQSNLIGETPGTTATLESTVASLEEAFKESQAKCAALLSGLGSSESFVQHLATVEQLTQKLQSMQSLLTQLRSHI